MWKGRPARCAPVLGVGAALALLISACGGADSTATPVPTARPVATAVPAPAAAPTPTPAPKPAPTEAPAPSPTQAPQRGGTLTMRALNQWPFRDAYDSRGGYSIQVFSSVMNTLITTDPYNFKTSEEIIGDVAESWEVSANGLTYIFKVRKGVRWHDGGLLTAKDVVYSYNRAITPPTPTVVFLKNKFETVGKVEAPDDFTVAITLTRPSASFLRGITLPQAQVMPAHIPDMAAFNKKPIGTGAFKFKSEAQNVEILVERNSEYFRPGLPYLDGVRYPVIPDVNLALAAFRTGQILTGNPYDGDVFFTRSKALQKDLKDVSAQAIAGARMDSAMNSKNPAFTDKRVRQALSLGFDRQTFDQIWLGGDGVPLASVMLPARLGGNWVLPDEELMKLPGFDPATKALDIAKARDLIKQAGYASGLKVKFVGSDQDVYRRGAEIFATQLKDLGIDANLTILGTVQSAEAQASGDFDLIWVSGSYQADDPALNFVTGEVRTGGAQNYGKWSFPEIDRLLDEQDRTLDVAKRRQLIWDVQREIFNQLPIIPLDYYVGDFLWWNKVQHFPKFYYSSGATAYKWDQVWLAK